MLHHLHLRNARHSPLKILQRDAAFGGQFHPQKHRHPKAQRRAVHLQPQTLDHPRLFQPLLPAPSGRLRQAQTAAQFARRQRALQRQSAQHGAVQII